MVGLGTSRYRGGSSPLRRGIELGAWIDTAESYGSEGIVAEAIAGTKREGVFVATKISPSHLGYRDLIKAADASLRRLNTGYIDLYQVHFPSSRVPIAETMGAMETLVDQGKVRFIGVSNFSTSQLIAAQEATSRHPVVSNQVRYSVTRRDVEADLLPYCQDNDVTLIAHTPLDRGGLTARSLITRRPAVDALEQVASEVGASWAQVALAWCLSRPNVVVIPKSDRVERVEENCAGRRYHADAGADRDAQPHCLTRLIGTATGAATSTRIKSSQMKSPGRLTGALWFSAVVLA